VAQHFTVINLFIFLIMHIYPPSFILLFASAAQVAQGLSYIATSLEVAFQNGLRLTVDFFRES
jgi:hypothetical protein